MAKNMAKNMSDFSPPLLFFLLVTSIANRISPLKHGRDAFEHQDYKTAYTWLQPLAEKGNPRAQLDLGLMYENGWGVKKVTATAVKWLQGSMAGKNATARKQLRALVSAESAQVPAPAARK